MYPKTSFTLTNISKALQWACETHHCKGVRSDQHCTIKLWHGLTEVLFVGVAQTGPRVRKSVSPRRLTHRTHKDMPLLLFGTSAPADFVP